MKNINLDSTKDFEMRAITLKKIMIELSIAHPSWIKGCSESEILELEQEYNLILPQSYKIFLKNFGHGLGGRIMKECDILYGDIFSLTKIVRNEILIEKGDPCLPENAFVFSVRYNEQFMFFDANNLVEDPSILYYMIDESNFTKIGDSIFDILESEVESSLSMKLYREQRNKKKV